MGVQFSNYALTPAPTQVLKDARGCPAPRRLPSSRSRRVRGLGSLSSTLRAPAPGSLPRPQVSIITNPLWVVKTRLELQRQTAAKEMHYRSTMQAVRR
jgi:hypothetical protein